MSYKPSPEVLADLVGREVRVSSDDDYWLGTVVATDGWEDIYSDTPIPGYALIEESYDTRIPFFLGDRIEAVVE